MHCGVMVTGYNQGDWGRLLAGDYDRPPAVPDAKNMDDTLYMGNWSSRWASIRSGQPNTTVCLLDAAQPVTIPSLLGGPH